MCLEELCGSVNVSDKAFSLCSPSSIVILNCSEEVGNGTTTSKPRSRKLISVSSDHLSWKF